MAMVQMHLGLTQLLQLALQDAPKGIPNKGSSGTQSTGTGPSGASGSAGNDDDDGPSVGTNGLNPTLDNSDMPIRQSGGVARMLLGAICAGILLSTGW